MASLKYSRQRESIIQYLSATHSHPTADMVYMHVKEEFPNISLGTVYRNLNLLVETGEICKIHCGDGADHFDGNTSDHYHFALSHHRSSHVSHVFPSSSHHSVDFHVCFHVDMTMMSRRKSLCCAENPDFFLQQASVWLCILSAPAQKEEMSQPLHRGHLWAGPPAGIPQN